MTDAVRPTYSESITAAAALHEVQMWRAAQTVRSHVSQDQGQDAMLECLGLQDVTRPADL
jgi:hypothetical protein